MRDGTRLARAFLQSEMYREHHRPAVGGGRRITAEPGRDEGPAGPRSRLPSTLGTQLALLGLLGLLDRLRGG